MANEDIEVHINSFFNFVEDSDDSISCNSSNGPENNYVDVPLKSIFSFDDNLDQTLENTEPVQNTVNNEETTGSKDVENLRFSINNQTKTSNDQNANDITSVQMGVVEKETTDVININKDAKEIRKIKLLKTSPERPMLTHKKGSKRFIDPKTAKKERRKCYRNYNDNKKLIICNFCGIFFVSKEEWIRHLKIHQTKVSTKISISPKLKKIVDHELLQKHSSAVSYRKLPNVKLSGANLPVKNHLNSFQLKCDMCSIVFTTLKHFKSHMKKHVQQKIINCQKSNQNNISQDNISRLTQHYGEKKFKCNICCKRYYLKQNLNEHMIVHTAEKIFKCPCCPKYFLHKVNMISHLRTHEMNFGCHLCSKRFSKKVLLDRHMAVHSGVKTYKCNICDREFSQKKYFAKHNLQTHQTFNCPTCLIEFTRRENYKHHINTIHKGKPYKCKICSAAFAFEAKLKYHLEWHTGDDKKFKCNICTQSFRRNPELLEEHLKTHANQEPYKCSYCSKAFVFARSLKLHEKNHTIKKVLCKVCGKGFALASQLKRHHGAIHEKRKDFPCTICSKSFAQKKNLQYHMFTHTGEKPHQCDICLKSFSIASGLASHKISVHLMKKYDCDQCSKQLSSSSALRRHKMQHSETRPFKCSLCSKSYIQKRLLDTHMLMHTGEKNFKCLTCSKAFVDRYKLNRHINTHLARERINNNA